MEAEHPVKQAFGSPGGKSYLASRIAGMIPEHKVYVEPFAGGAAVYFRKEPSEKEVLSDKDTEIAFAFRFLRGMTPEQFGRLKKFNWKITRVTFDRVKAMKPKDDVERFYKFYYLKKGSVASGGNNISPIRQDTSIDIGKLVKVHNRLHQTNVKGIDALILISKYDSPNTFFYLDPPYPDRAFVGQSFGDWTEDNLTKLVSELQHIKGKFALSLGVEHIKLLPKSWHIKRVKVRRNMQVGRSGWSRPYQYEIIATNYKPEAEKRRVTPRLHHLIKRVKRRGNGYTRRESHQGIITSR